MKKSHCVAEETITSSSYEMDFSDDNGPNNNRQPQNETRRPGHNGKGYISVILLAVVLTLMISLMLYFFVFRGSSLSYTFTSSDIQYRIDTDHDGKAEVNPDGSPDFSGFNDPENQSFSIYDPISNPEGIIMPLEKENADDLTFLEVLVSPYDYSVVMNAIRSNIDPNTVYIQGQFNQPDSNGRSITASFSMTLTNSDFETYLKPIIQYVEYIPDNMQEPVAYYNGRHYQYGIESTSSISSWLLPLVLTLVFVGIIFFFYNRMSKSLGGGSGGPMAGFVNNIARKETSSKVRFSDVAGCDEAKAELVELVDYFHSTDKYTRLGAKLPHGVLLVGPPGTGKTLLAKAVAGEASVPFYSISGSDFVEMYVGVGASRVRSLFKTAKANAPCLIFIDEIDAVGRQRGAGLGGGNDEREQTLNELLVEMDGFEDNSGIIVMAATNRSDVLDPALTRPGRFDRTITVDLPDKNGRAAILKVHSRNKKLANDVSLEDIASRTVGFSGADLANIMNDAAILAVRANRNAITTADIDEAIDRAISGPAKKSHLEPNEKKQVAYHESGHAVIGIFLPYSDVVQKITIVPRGRTGGHVLMTPAQDHFLLTKNQLMARITGYLGGRTSEEIFFGDVSTGASNDIEVATQLARSMVTQYGMSDLGPIQYERPGGSVFLGRDYNSTQANYSTQIAFEIDKAVRDIIDQCHEKAKALLNEHSEDVKLIAETLIEHETITADQIEYLLKNRHLPPVDEHKLTSEEGVHPKNPNNIILYPGFEPFYIAADRIMAGNPSRFVLAVATGSGNPITDNEFKSVCVRGASDPSRIGMMFLEFSQTMRISLSLETFASHMESYVGTSVLLIKTDDASIRQLKAIYEPKNEAKEEKAKMDQERPGVVQEILPSDKTEETKTDSTDENADKPDNPDQNNNSQQGGN